MNRRVLIGVWLSFELFSKFCRFPSPFAVVSAHRSAGGQGLDIQEVLLGFGTLACKDAVENWRAKKGLSRV